MRLYRTRTARVVRRLRALLGLGLFGGLGPAAALGQGPAPVTAPPRPTQTAPLVFQGVTVVDVVSGTRLPQQQVVVIGHRIEAVRPMAGAAPLPRGARVVEARGKYLIPGLWDMHYHLYRRGVEIEYRRAIANGVTGIRDPFAPNKTSYESGLPGLEPRQWQQAVMAGTRVGPRQPQQVWTSRYRTHGLATRSLSEIRRGIDSVAAAGGKFLKLAPSGLGTAAVYPPAVYFAVLSAARRHGLHVVGHPPPSGVSLLQGADNGQRTFEHHIWLRQHGHLQGSCDGDSATVATCRTLAQALRQRRAWLTPTMAFMILSTSPKPLISPRRLTLKGIVTIDTAGPVSSRMYDSVMSSLLAKRSSRWRTNKAIFALMQQADMPLLAGSDHWGITVHEELALSVALGLTPLRALQTATVEPAKYLEATDTMGTVAAGKVADLVLLDADPLADITNTTRIRGVVADGRYYVRSVLDQLIVEAQTQYRKQQAAQP